MQDHRLSEAAAEQGLGLSNSPSERSTEGGHEITQLPELQSPSGSTSTPPLSASRSPGRTVRELARKLSQQNLKLGRYGTITHSRPLQQLEAPKSLSTLPPSPPLPAVLQDLADLPDFPESQVQPILEVDADPEVFEDTSKHDPTYLSHLSVARRRSQFFRGERYSAEGGEASGSKSTGAALRKQLSSQFREKPTASIANTARVEQMISSGTQCNVQTVPPAQAPTPTSTTATTATIAPVLKPEPHTDYVYSPMELEVDEAYCNGNLADTFEEDLSFMESVVSLRRAGAPGGIRKQMVGGIPLRYQLSADAAMRCQTVVKNRPRMRRRKKTRPESMASSAATSSISSPVIPPSIPPPHPNPY